MTRTIIYIDGYNLYYSRLKGTPYKWLDIGTLFKEQILRPQDPSATVVAIKYFTAPVKASYARHGVASVHAQNEYHRALLAMHSGLLQIVPGFHIFGSTHMPTHVDGQNADKAMLSKVWRIEEKQTDVNLALQVYRDAVTGACDQQVICTNDSDMEPALTLVKQDCPAMKIGLVIPLREKSEEQDAVPNKRLTTKVDWVRKHILDSELANSMLPQHVNTRKRPASRPGHW